jgi:sec-independent protein translocase protein TatB
MFDIGWSELVVIGIVALIAIGPKELPGVLRMLGQWMGKVRRMASDFQGQFQEAMREAEMADLKKEVDQLTDFSKDFGSFDPVETARKEIETAIDGKPDAPSTPAPALDENGMPVNATAAAPVTPDSVASTPSEPAAPADAPAADVAAVPDAARAGEGGRAA